MNLTTLRGFVVAGCTLAATAVSAETLILAEGLPNGHFHSKYTSGPLMECITAGTNGAIDFNYMPGGQLLKMKDGTKGVVDGIADIAFISVGNEPSTYPLNGLTMLPGLASSAVEATTAWRKALDNGGKLAGEIDALGLTLITTNILAPYQAVGKEVLDDPAKWAGKKLRVSGSALAFMVDAIGGTAVQFPATELFVAMQRGTVDGTILSFASLKPYSVHEIATHYSRNLALGTSTSMYAIRTDRLKSLPEDQQKVILDCGRQVEQAAAQSIDDNEAKIAAEMTSMGHTVYDVSAENKAKFAEALKPVEAELVKRVAELGFPAEEALGEYKAALGN